MAFLNEKGLERLWTHITTKLGTKVDKVGGKGLSTNDYTDEEKNKLAGIAEGANKTVVDSVLSDTSTNPVQNKVIYDKLEELTDMTPVSEQIATAIANKSDSDHNHDSDYDKKGAADTALASAKTYADSAATKIKNDLLNGAGAAYDTLKELGDLIDDNQDAIEALEKVAAGKANETHTHAISDVTNLQTTLDAKVPTSRTINGNVLSSDITLSASDVGADASGSANTALTNAKAYTDAEITEWVGDKKVSEQIASAQLVYVGPTKPTDPNIKVWINTTEDGTGVIPVMPRISTINLSKTSWSGSSSPYYQAVSINTVTSATKVELNPTVSQIVSLQNDDIALMAQNDAGTVTIYSFGGKPSADMSIQVTLTEVSYV